MSAVPGENGNGVNLRMIDYFFFRRCRKFKPEPAAAVLCAEAAGGSDTYQTGLGILFYGGQKCGIGIIAGTQNPQQYGCGRWAGKF